MRTRPVLILCVILQIAASGLAEAKSASDTSAAKRPNILLIVADDMGFSDLGCYGSEISTPNIDALAAGGVKFQQFYNTARCCPSRASLLTGLYSHQAGIGLMTADRGTSFPGYRGFLTTGSVTIAEALKPAGYRTYMVGKWHLSQKAGPIQRGFDEYFGLLEGMASYFDQSFYKRLPAGRMTRKYAPGDFYSTDAFGDYALDFLRDARTSPTQPWFMYLAFNAPHFPIMARAEEIAKYGDVYEAGWDVIRAKRLERQKQLGLFDTHTTLSPRSVIPANWAADETGWSNKDNPAWESLPEDRRHDLARRMAVYAAMVTRMDYNVGRVVANLREHGQLDNTLILFMSDNGACAEWDPFGFDENSGPTNTLHTGPHLNEIGTSATYESYGSAWANASNTPLRLYKHYIHEGGISSPLIVHCPSMEKPDGKWRESAGHIIDVMPTILEAAHAQYPHEHLGKTVPPMAGVSLWPAIRGEDLNRDYLAWEHEGSRGIRIGDWKLVSVEKGEWELYNLATDRVEMHNVAANETPRVRTMAAQWEHWAKSHQVLPQPAMRKPVPVR